MERNAFKKACDQLEISLSEEQVSSFEAFETALYEWNVSKNLTRIPKEDCWLMHFVDSLLVGHVIKKQCPGAISILDIGTGAGFPAWPLACAFPDWEVFAIDSNGKMLDFLKTRPLNNLSVRQLRAEKWDRTEAFDVVTGRALAPLAVQLEVSIPLAKQACYVVPMRTPNDALPNEEALAKLGVEFVVAETLSLGLSNIERMFPVYRRNQRFDKRARRRWADIKKKPIF